MDDLNGWVVAAHALLATTDGGSHWHSRTTCPTLRSVDFVNTQVGFGVAGGTAPYEADGVGGSGAQLVVTHDGGRDWHPAAAPADVQSVCFADTDRGWLGADGHIYGTDDGGRTWHLEVRGAYGSAAEPALAELRCVPGSLAAWAELAGPGGMMSQGPHLGYHTANGTTWTAIFAEQYFPHPRVRVTAQSPGSYAGPFAAISATRAVYIDYCPACSPPSTPAPKVGDHTTYQGTAPMDLVQRGGSKLVRRGTVTGLTIASATDFVTADKGWAVGLLISYHLAGSSLTSTSVNRIVHTSDGGRTWHIQYQSP